MPPPNWPQIIVEGGFAPASPVQDDGTFVLDDAANGVLDTSMLGTAVAWSDLSAFMRSGSVNRPASRQQGPLWSYQPGTASIVLKNGDGRFDPDNLSGPYVDPGRAGIAVGAYLDQPSYGTAGWAATYAAWQAITGIGLPVTRWYLGASTFTFTGSLVTLAANGTRICLDLKPAYNPVSAADLESMESMLRAMQAAGADVRISLWHEPNLDGLTAAQYVAMMKYYGPTVRKYYELWCCFSGSDAIESNGYFPGDGQVDGIAVDDYATGTSSLDNGQAMADAHGLPLALWEFNAAHDFGIGTSPVTGVTQAQNQGFFTYVQNLFTNRMAAGKPCGDILLFSAGTGGSTGSGNFLGTSLSQNGGFEGGLGNWVPHTNSTIATSAAWSKSGSSSLAITAIAAGTTSASSCAAANVTTQALAVSPGQTVGFSAWFRAATTARTVQAGVLFRDSAGTLTGTSYATPGSDSTTADTFSSGSATVPAGTAYAVLDAQVSGAAAGEVHYADDPQIGTLPSSIDHTAPVQYPWDYRIPLLAAMQQALSGQGATAAATNLNAMVPVRVRAAWGGAGYPLFSGFTDSWDDDGANYGGRYAEVTVAATDAQKVLNGITIAPGGPAGSGETTGARITRILDMAFWYTGTGQRLIDTGKSAVIATSYGDTAWNLMQQAADAEIGELYIDGSGAVVFRDRTSILTGDRSATPQQVFGDAIGATGMGIADGTFESGISAWSATGGTVSLSSAQSNSGTQSALVTVSGSPSQTFLRPVTAKQVPVTPGLSYTAYTWIFPGAGGMKFHNAIDWHDANGTYISTSSGTSSTLTAAEWSLLEGATSAAPPGAAFAVYGPTLENPSPGQVFYADDVSIWPSYAYPAGAPQLPYKSASRARDGTTMANDIQATRASTGDADTPVLQEARDAGSIAKYLFPRTYTRSDLILEDDATTLQWAHWVLYVASTDEDRFDQLVINPLRDPVNLWPEALGRQIGDRIQVWRHPPGVTDPVVKDCFIRGIAHAWDVSAGTWTTTWTLQDASKYGSFMTLDNAVLGQLDSNALAF